MFKKKAMEEELKYFLDKLLIQDVRKLIDNEQEYVALIIMAQSIETLGAFLDAKPFRAKAQSKKRFNLALKKLFTYKYRKANDKFFLYDKLRNHIAHILIPSARVELIDSTSQAKHMDVTSGTLYISIEDFYTDVKSATEQLIAMINNGELKYKRLDLSKVKI